MNKIRNIIDFIAYGIWLKKDEEYKSSKARWAVRQAKVFILTAKGFGSHDIAVRSAALTFYTLMAIVPVLALAFGIIKGFGLEENLYQYLYSISSDNFQILIDTIIEFANNMLDVRTSGGLIAGVGFIVLLYAVVNVFSSVEAAFNHIWEVRKQRSLPRKVSDYTTVVIVAPILFIVYNNMSSYLQRTIAIYTHEFVAHLIFGLGSLIVIWLMFAFIYIVMPNTKVKIKGAMIAAIVSGTTFVVFQQLYELVQSFLTSYNAIYGTFAALPLLLIWLQVSWQILLLGAELSFAYQHIKRYEQELEAQSINYESRRKVAVATMLAIVSNFIKGGEPMGSDNLADILNLPVRVVRDVTFELEKSGLVISAHDDKNKRSVFMPARDISELTVMDVIYRIEGSGGIINIDTTSDDMKRVANIFDRIKSSAISSRGNVRLVTLLNELDKEDEEDTGAEKSKRHENGGNR